MTRTHAALGALAVTLLSLTPGMARAQTLYGSAYFPPQLITIDPVTGAGTLVGPLGIALPFGLDFRGANLYSFDQATKMVVQLDPATGKTLAIIDIGAVALGVNGEGDCAKVSSGKGDEM